MDIQTTLQHIANGNRQAFALLVERFQRPLFSYLGRMGFTQAQAEDLAQETFTRAWQHLGQYDAQKAEFSTWLATWQFVCAGIAAVQWYCPALPHRLCA